MCIRDRRWDVRINGGVRPGSNAWLSKAKAEEVYRAKEAAGLCPSASIEWVAGHL